MKLLQIILVFSLALGGCASLVEYSPKPSNTIEQALFSVERAINTNPLKKGIILNFADEKHLELVGTFRGGGSQKYILYESINSLILKSKRSWFSVTISDVGEAIQHRFYFSEERKAKKLIDGLTRLKNHKFDKSIGYELSIRFGEKVKKITPNGRQYDIEDENVRLKREIERLKEGY